MGLLERALEYKRKINEEGKETLIDRLNKPTGPDIKSQVNAEKINAAEFDEIASNNEINEPNEPNEPIEESIIEERIIEEKENAEPTKNESPNDDTASEEDILLADAVEPLAEDFSNPKEVNDEIISDSSIEANEEDNILSEETEVEEILRNDDLVEITDTESKSGKHEGSDDHEFNYYSMLYEIQKEFVSADTLEEIYSILIFSIMGQLGVSSASIIVPSQDDESRWVITDSQGIKIADAGISWRIDEGILEILNDDKQIIDLEDFKKDAKLRDDYYKFTSVDARIITPITENYSLKGAILIGEKINFEDFTAADMEFLYELSEISSSKVESFAKQESVKSELNELKTEKEILSDIESFKTALLNVSSISELEEILKQNFYSLGIESYAIFMKDHLDGDYYPVQHDQGDSLEFGDTGFKIKKDNRLVNFLLNKRASIMLEDFVKSVVVIDTFGKSRVAGMNYFIACPFIIFGNLLGFITIFKINPEVNISDIDIRIQRINGFLLPYLDNIYEADRSLNRYNDLTAGLFSRIKSEIEHAHGLNIYFSLLVLTIKNYKAFHERFGVVELEKLFKYMAEIIDSKLNAGDFSVKFDRNRFIIALPGKDKRYSIMLANLIKNDVVNKYSTSDFKLLMTSLTAVYPDDGTDLFSILEVLE